MNKVINNLQKQLSHIGRFSANSNFQQLPQDSRQISRPFVFYAIDIDYNSMEARIVSWSDKEITNDNL